MAEVWTMGELLCEIMRPEPDMALDKPGTFLGPFPSGAPAICIDAVARLGHSAGLIGCVGDDDFGKCLLDRLKADGVDCSQVQVAPAGSTGVAFVTYFSDGSRRFLYHFSETPATRAKAPVGDIYGDDVKYFHLMGCSLMASPTFAGEILKVLRALTAKGAKVSFDPNIRPELLKDASVMEVVGSVFDSCSIFLPGESELLLITGENSVDAALDACFAREKMELVVLKNGSRGCTICTRERRTPLGIYTVDVKDATGAGDSFDGAFLCGLLEGKDPVEAAKMATAAAALNTAAFGPMEGDINPETVAAMIANNTLVLKA